MRTLRLLLATAGGALATVGGVLLLADTREGTGPQVALWLASAVLLHDLLLAPLVLLLGWALVRSSARGVLRGALIVAGCLTLVALPMMFRPGTPSHPSVLPLDYPRNWAVSLAAVALVSAGVLLVRWLRARRRSGPARSTTSGAADAT